MPQTDAELVARVLADDDRQAFGELVRRHQAGVRTLLRRLCAGDSARADDLAQESFLRAYRKLSTYRGDAKLSTWLYRLAWNLYTSDSRHRPAPEPAAAEERAAAPMADRADARHDLTRALASLREEERAALALTYGQGLSHEEAAQILDWPLGTLKSHVARGKERLRELLGARAEAS